VGLVVILGMVVYLTCRIDYYSAALEWGCRFAL
jgi:hypothetical protein